MSGNEMMFELEGLACADCAAKIEKKVQGLPDVSVGEVNFMNRSLRVVLEDSRRESKVVPQIESIVHFFEPEVIIRQKRKEDSIAYPLLKENDVYNKKVRTLKRLLIAGGVLFAGALGLEFTGFSVKPVIFVMYLTAYMILGYPVLLKAGSNIIKGRIFDENFLMSIATIGALLISQWSEAAAVMLFYQVGELFQMEAVNRSRRSITELISIRPDYANIQSGDTLIRVNPDTVRVGDRIVVKPGEKVPLDGIIRTGRSSIDSSALTGESIFRDVEEGDAILSGSINKDGVLSIEVTALFGESTVSKIIEMVSAAGSKKSRSENLISRFAAVYTPAVVVAALLLAVIPTLFFEGVFSVWIYRALSFLVISCPCALVISVPLGYFGGIGASSRRGILVKGSNYLDALSRADSIVFDKTGTLTRGVFKVTKIVPADRTGSAPAEAKMSDAPGCEALAVSDAPVNADSEEMNLLRIASVAEVYSDHPIALSVRMAAQERGIDVSGKSFEAYREMAGRGVSVQSDDGDILVGNRKLMIESGIEDVPDVMTSGVLLFVAVDHRFAGYLEIEDEIKPEAKGAISLLQKMHIQDISMLTGDHASSADKAAGRLGIKNVYSELLPAQKLEKIEEILEQKSADPKAGTLVYVGDGINDAPVLARADIGVAIGVMASGAAIEAADIVIMTNDVESLPRAIRIARKTKRIVMENIFFALSVKGLILILAALGLTNLWFAIFADVGVAVLAILNSVRAGSSMK